MPRARGLASALLGALAGIAAAGAIVASAPVVGRAGVFEAMAAVPAAVDGDDAGHSRGGTAPAVSAVITPALEAGVERASSSEANQP